MTIYSLDICLSQFWISYLFHVWVCCFLTCIQVSQETGKVVWYSHLCKNFPQFVMIHTVNGFSVINEAELDVFSVIPLIFLWSNKCWQFEPELTGTRIFFAPFFLILVFGHKTGVQIKIAGFKVVCFWNIWESKLTSFLILLLQLPSKQKPFFGGRPSVAIFRIITSLCLWDNAFKAFYSHISFPHFFYFSKLFEHSKL